MKIPAFLKPGDTIGVTAPSHGIGDPVDKERFLNGERQLEEKGYHVIFTENVFAGNDRFGRSSSAREKAAQFETLLKDPQVKAIISASGGDFLAEMLPYLDLDLWRENPKWVQGYSDNTSLLYFLTTKGDIATAYGANFGDFGMEPWQSCVTQGLGVLEGKVRVQESFETYQDGFRPAGLVKAGYSADRPVEWKNVIGAGEGGGIRMQGRLIGGCLDVLMNLAGTPYDGTMEFIEKYQDDGIIWYLESFDLGFEQMMESLWKMKEMGWFTHATGIVFGRPLFYAAADYAGNPLPSYEDVLHERLDELKIPVILDADLGHRGPQLIWISGARAQVTAKDGKGTLRYLD